MMMIAGSFCFKKSDLIFAFYTIETLITMY
jgi:hypothetical protein